MATNWTDITSYSRGERKEPRTWELQLPWIIIIVTRHKDYPGKWLMNCRQLCLDMHELTAKEIGDAREEAVKMCVDRCKEYLRSLLEQRM